MLSGRWIAPEQGERLIEDVLVLVAMDHGRAQGRARLDFRAEIDAGQCFLRRNRLGRSNRQSGSAQQAGKLHHVGPEAGIWLGEWV